MKYSPKLVLRVNELYHDIEGSEYENKHPNIFIDEVMNWQRMGKQFISKESKKISILDIGTGTGFVPLNIGMFLKKNDLFICSDISKNMLKISKKNILDTKFKCDFKYLKLDGKELNLKSNSLDYITLNSVLHHIPNLSTFFKEIDRLLKVDGLLIIGHEPNKAFYLHKFLWNNYRFIYFLIQPKQLIVLIVKKLKLIKIARKIYHQKFSTHDKIIKDVNKHLLREGIIKNLLTSGQICEIVDIHSPTAGGYHKGKGIDISEILRDYLPNFRVVYLETYNHLSKVSSKSKFTKGYDSFLKKRYPKNGATFFMILKKVS